MGSNSRNGCCSRLSSCCHSALANETLSAEPTGERGGGVGLCSSSDRRNAIGWAPALSESKRVTNQNVSHAEEFHWRWHLITAGVSVDGRGWLMEVLTGRPARRWTATNVFGLFWAPQEWSGRGRRSGLCECRFHFQSITAPRLLFVSTLV